MIEKKTILIADDDKDLLDVLTIRCEQLGLYVITAEDAMTALSCIDFAVPDLVCLDVNMPAGNGLSVCEMMVTDSRLRCVPVIIMTGNTDTMTERRCHEMAAFYVRKSENTWARIEPLIRELLAIDEPAPSNVDVPQSSDVVDRCDSQTLDVVCSALDWETTLLKSSSEDEARPKECESPWVLCVEDDSDFSFNLKMRLLEYGVDVVRAFNGIDGYRYAFTSEAQAIILDYEMPEANGDCVLRRLKDNPVTRDIPVIVVTGRNDSALKRKMLNMGATAYLTKPVRWEGLWMELREHLTLRDPVMY